MKPCMAITLADEELWLLADKAIYYPAEHALLIADALWQGSGLPQTGPACAAWHDPGEPATSGSITG